MIGGIKAEWPVRHSRRKKIIGGIKAECQVGHLSRIKFYTGFKVDQRKWGTKLMKLTKGVTFVSTNQKWSCNIRVYT